MTPNLKQLAAKRGLIANELSPGYWRITGGQQIIDYWPNSKRRTAMVIGGESRPRVGPEEAVEMAGLPTPKDTLDNPSKRTPAQWIELLPHLRFAWRRR
jgi:hypothetical protein